MKPKSNPRSSAPSAGRTPVVIVTGASQGIGAAIAREFARAVRGVRLVLLARNERNLRRTAAACVRLGARPAVMVCDVTDEASVTGAAREVARTLGPADVLVNNAGVFTGRPFLEMPVAEFDALLATNLRSVFLVSKAFVPAMAKRGRGHVFNLSSIAGLDAYPNGAGYCAAKFGVTGLGRVMRAELRARGVLVTNVHPGATWTPSWKGAGVAPARMMPASGVARAIVEAWRLGPATLVEDLVLRPPLGDV